MFEYFEGNYTWNMAFNLALAMGGSIGDLDDVSRPLRAVARHNDDEAAQRLFAAWGGLGDKLREQAERDAAKGRRLSAGEKYRRAAVYYVQAERMQSPHFEPRKKTYSAMLHCFEQYILLTAQNCTRCEVPFDGSSLPSLFVNAQQPVRAERAPCMIHFDGLDVTKEIIYLLGVPQAFAARGVSTLIVDNPGVGESLRFKNLHNGAQAEKPAGAALDFLEQRNDVDPARIGIIALSLGGFHAPRAAAFEPRLACAVAWGAQYDYGAIQRARAAARENSLPVPHYWDHTAWAFGVESVEQVLEATAAVSLAGILHRIRCPVLVTHGENDRQIPLDVAKRVVEECVNSEKAELHVHTLNDGGAEHCSVDNIAPARELMADWVAETLGVSVS
jgi:dienelactone hydrolase